METLVSGLMFLQGRINDQHVSMLVDTGASHSFMSPQMVKSLGLFPMRVDNPHRGEVCERRTSGGGASGGECADRVRDVERGRKFYHLRDGRHRCRLGLDVSGGL